MRLNKTISIFSRKTEKSREGERRIKGNGGEERIGEVIKGRDDDELIS